MAVSTNNHFHRYALALFALSICIFIVYTSQVLLPLYNISFSKAFKDGNIHINPESGAPPHPPSNSPIKISEDPSSPSPLHPQPAKSDDSTVNPTILDTSSSSNSIASSSKPSSATVTGSNSDDSHKWVFNTTRDARAYGLTSEECEAGFPGLFSEIERAVAYRQKIGHVTVEDTDVSWREDGVVRALIFDQQLYILESKLTGSTYGSTRALAILHSIHRAIITSPTSIPNIEFSFSPSDLADPERVGRSIWSLSRTADQEEKWLMSDFGYWSWPVDLVGGYEQIRREMEDGEINFEDKIKQVVWRGAVQTNPHRSELLEVTRGKGWADVKGVSWANATEVKKEDMGNALHTSEQCQYMFVVQTEGHSYSGRGKYLQNCNSVVIIPTPRTWLEPHHPLLVPSGEDQNFVEVKPDFSDLEEKVLGLLADPKKAKGIANNGVTVFRDRYLTAAAQTCYWRRLFEGWSEVSFEPEAWEPGTDRMGRRKVRGVAFETFAIQMIVPVAPSCSWWRKIIFQC